MTGVNYRIADFKTGGLILDLPVLEGSSWSTTLDKADQITAVIDLRDPDVQALDIGSTTTPDKTVIFAETDDGAILAIGLVPDRTWDDDARQVSIDCAGLWSYPDARVIAPVAARTTPLVNSDGSPNTALDTTITDVGPGTRGKRLMQLILGWPGATALPFDLPDDDVLPAGSSSVAYSLLDLKTVGSALTDITAQESGVDFAFDAHYDSTGIALRYVMRAGTAASPLLGTYVGVWSEGAAESDVYGLKVKDDGKGIATAVWMTAGKSTSSVIASLALNDSLINDDGYVPFDVVDTSRSTVELQATLDDYAAENLSYGSKLRRTITFSVRKTATPGLGQFRPGDTVDLDISEGNLYLPSGPLRVRILSIKGDETGQFADVTVADVSA
ncbi:MAG: hypothetical protein JWO98_5339 [Frankiales bacterium]|nr:hypothetical protein [Frankiales bacterium]